MGSVNSNDSKYMQFTEHPKYVDIIMPLCRGCDMLRAHVMWLLPILKCGYSVNIEVLIDGVKKALMDCPQDLSGLPIHFNLLIPMSVGPEEIRRLLGVLTSAGIPPTSIHLHTSWELFLDIVSSDYLTSIFKNVARVYVYVESIRESKTLLKLVASKPLSKFRSIVTIVYYATSMQTVKEVLEAYDWNGAPHILLIVRTNQTSNTLPFVHEFEAILKHRDFFKASESQFMGFPVKWYVDTKGCRWVGLVVLRDNMDLFKETSILAHPLHLQDTIASLIRDRVDMCKAKKQLMGNIVELLCRQMLWKIKIEAVVDGVTVLDNDLYEILNALKKWKTLRAACKYVNKSYPTVKKRIVEVEKVLGINIVRSVRGGAHRGFSELTVEGELLLEVYEKLKQMVEKSLEQHVKKVCRELVSRRTRLSDENLVINQF